MKRFFTLILLGSLFGLVVGYIMFARSTGGFIPPATVLGYNSGSFQDFVNGILGIDSVRMNIGLSTLAGGILGILIFASRIGAARRY